MRGGVYESTNDIANEKESTVAFGRDGCVNARFSRLRPGRRGGYVFGGNAAVSDAIVSRLESVTAGY